LALFATLAVAEITENRGLGVTEIIEFGGDCVAEITGN